MNATSFYGISHSCIPSTIIRPDDWIVVVSSEASAVWIVKLQAEAVLGEYVSPSTLRQLNTVTEIVCPRSQTCRRRRTVSLIGVSGRGTFNRHETSLQIPNTYADKITPGDKSASFTSDKP